ncbi:hypothetical protein WA026_005096 [Henosepilachna vigintioctopunctata]|uniref:Uncharacterized protein n=1 Tax=Henosepilachna vigintioctopunctata TaxID=420089 RepID=A0AAW1USW8_9CUCU
MNLLQGYNQLKVDGEIYKTQEKTYMNNQLFSSFEEKYNFCVERPETEELMPGKNENYWASPSRKQEEDVSQGGIHLLRLRGGALTKSPLAECEEVMEQFDKILREYRNALSPCGQIGCNFAPNIVEAACNQTCYNILDTGISTDGCGSPECEYAKYKKSLIPLDFDIEKQFIGPAIIGNCGHPKCPYQMEPILPPIHWECPEPLPAGKCTNPNCPYVPNDLPYHTRLSTTKGPCGSNECPYLPPAPCCSPNCPFRNAPPCASAKEALHNRKERKENKAKNFASCPFSNPPTIINVMQLCDNPDCDVLKRAMQSGDCTTRAELCNSPNCPVKSIRKKCSNPECPFTKSELDSKCSNPDCPLNGGSSESCSNPNCPFAKSSTELTQFSSEATQERSKSEEVKVEPTETEISESCVNPECPFNAPSIESCKNPECPFKEEKPIFQESKESCDNPECPFKQGSRSSTESQSRNANVTTHFVLVKGRHV